MDIRKSGDKKTAPERTAYKYDEGAEVYQGVEPMI